MLKNGLMFADSYNAPYDIGDMSLAAEGHALILRRVNSKQPLLEVGLHSRPCKTSGTVYLHIGSHQLTFFQKQDLAEGVPEIRTFKRSCFPCLAFQTQIPRHSWRGMPTVYVCKQCKCTLGGATLGGSAAMISMVTVIDRRVCGVLVRRL